MTTHVPVPRPRPDAQPLRSDHRACGRARRSSSALSLPRAMRGALSLAWGTACLLPAQGWDEAGDAGALPAYGQLPLGAGPLTLISGTLAAGVQSDADMYLIQIDDPVAFHASTTSPTGLDSQLFLFDLEGRGITFSDNDGPSPQASISGASIPTPGKYWLAVSGAGREPLAATGLIWNDLPLGPAERAPDGLRQREFVDGWAGFGPAGDYSIVLIGARYPAVEVVLPDYQHLCESQVQLGNAGSTAWWRQSGGRFQILYEASHLTGTAGVTGPIVVRRLKFRGEDGEPNRGGQSWVGAVVQVGSTSLSAAGLSNSFATNRDPLTTTLGASGTTTVTVLPSLGATPNNHNIVIDLVAIGAAYTHDPTGTRPNLLIDITLPTAATGPATAGVPMPFQDAVGTAAQVRGRGLTTAVATAATGSTSATPLVVGLDIDGSGSHAVIVPARNEFYGGACHGSHASFYQSFLQGQRFDLRGLTLTPDFLAAPTRYLVTGAAAPFDPSKVGATPVTIGDDATVSVPLGFTHAYPGGATASIGVCTNGFVWLDPAMTSNDFSPTVGEFLGTAARHAPCWTDLHAGRNVATHPNSGLHVVTDVTGGPGNAVCYVTWLDVGLYNSVSTAGAGGHAVHAMQCVIHEATGVVEYRYGTTIDGLSGGASSAALVGFTRGLVGGFPSSDPQSRDLSVEVPFETRPEVLGVNAMGQTAVATPEAGGAHYSGRMYGGQTITWNADNVPFGSMIGVQLVDITSLRPGLQAPGLLALGCMLSVTPSATLWELFLAPPPTVIGTIPLVIPPGFEGTEIYAQFVVLGALPTDTLVGASSNALKHRVGLD